MITSPSYSISFLRKNISDINRLLEENNFSSWYFGFKEEDEVFYLSIFDVHNPQEELVFTVSNDPFEVSEGYRYKKVKRSVIRPEHIRFQEAIEVLSFIHTQLHKKIE